MHYLSLDYIIVYAFLLITLVIGLWAGRGIKDIREYAIANRQFGVGALTITLLATYIGGWHLFGFPSDVFADGLTHIIPELVCGVVVCLLFIALFIAPKMVHFKGCLTMGDLMKIFYGEYGSMTTGVLGLIYNTTAISIQIVFLGHLCELLGIKSDWGLILAAFILTIYTAKGGMKAVVMTDILQFTAIVAVVPLLAHLITYQAGGIRALLSSVPQEKLQLFNFEQDKAGAFSTSYYAFPILTLWMLFPGFPLSFPFIQRMLMAQNKRQSVSAYYTSIAFMVPFFLLLTLIGLAVLVIYPQINSQDVLTHIVSNLPVGLKGLVWTALLAVVMSTTDSFLHAAGVSFTHDLIKPFLEKKGVAINELKVVQYTTLLIGCLAIVVVLGVRDISKIAMYGMDLAALLFTIPLIAGIMGLKTDIRSFLVSLFTTLALFTLTKLYLGEDLVIPICILVNALSFFGTHYLYNKGFAITKHSAGQQEGNLWQPGRESIGKRFKNLLPTPTKLLHYYQENTTKYGASPTLFALFIAFSYMVPLFMHSYAAPAAYNWLLTIKGIGTLLCVGLLLESQWPTGLLSYFSVYYHFSLLYCLPFVTTFLFLLEGGNIEWIVNVALSIMLLIVLTDWLTFILLSAIGVALAMGVYKLGLGPLTVNIDIDTMYTLVYTLTFSTLIGLLFARRKQQRFDRINTHNKSLIANNQESQDNLLETFRDKIRIIQSLQHAGIQDLLQVAKLVKEVRIKAHQEALPLSETAARLEATLIPMALQLRSIEARATNFMRLSIEGLPIQDLLHHLQEHLATKGSHTPLKYYVTTHVKALTCDPKRLQTLLVSSITALRTGEESSHLLLGIEDTRLCYDLPSVNPGYQKRVAALRFTITTLKQLPKLEPSYTASMHGTSLSTPETAQELVLLENKRIMGAHYGYMHATPDTFTYVLPVQLEDVRPEDVDSPHMELGAVPVRADDQYPGAQAQEEAFLQALQAKSTADLELVKSVIELIKWYHGPVKRQTGEPFYLHPLAVAKIVLDYNQEEATILAALLHDTVEDTVMLLSDIQAVFGKDTADLVDTVTHLESGQDGCYKIKLSATENIMMLVQSGDDRAMYVKLADRLHNMRTIAGKSPESQIRISKETVQFFVPQAYKLRLDATVEELTTRSQRILEQHGATT